MRLILAVILVGCSSCTISTAAVVHRFEGSTFRACQISLGWYTQELIDECGSPDNVVRRVGKPKQVCAVYTTNAHALAASEVAAPYLVVCLVPTSLTKRAPPFAGDESKWPLTKDQLTAMKVTNVFGVDRVPWTETQPSVQEM